MIVMIGAEFIKDPICGKLTNKHGLNHCGTKSCEESELIYDLKTKYLGNFDHLRDVQPISFEKACEGKHAFYDLFISSRNFKVMYNLISPLSQFFSEMILNYNNQLSIDKKFDQLIKSIQKAAEVKAKSFAIFIDELPPSFFEICPDYQRLFSDLQAKCPLVHVFLAISPSGRNLSQPIAIQFEDDKVFAKQLRTRHRNSFLLSCFLIHITYNYNRMNQSGSKFQCLSPAMDVALDPSVLPEGDITLWYNKTENITDVEILQFLHKTYLPKDGQVLVSPLQQNLSQPVYDWCRDKKWDVVSHGNMIGSERDLVIAFADNKFGNLEILSRAKNRLIIVTRYWLYSISYFDFLSPEKFIEWRKERVIFHCFKISWLMKNWKIVKLASYIHPPPTIQKSYVKSQLQLEIKMMLPE